MNRNYESSTPETGQNNCKRLDESEKVKSLAPEYEERELKTEEENPVDTAGNGPVVFSKMAPRKVKTQGKRNRIKIKSKVNSQKRGPKSLKKSKKSEKPLENLKWLNKLAAEGSIKKSDAVPEWLNNNAYKHKMALQASDTNTSEFEEYPPQDAEEKSSASDASEECNCSHSKYPDNGKGGILKRKVSSSNSLVANYIKSGMDQVASFIVESAIRFGEQHGVVVPDKNTPNVYEITSPDKRFEEKYRKIRFKIPDRNPSGYEGPKKPSWRSHNKGCDIPTRRAQTPMPDWKINHPSKASSWTSNPDSLEEILPILEKLQDDEDIVMSDLDLEKLANASATDHVRKRGRDRERLKKKFRMHGKRYKSLDAISDKGSEDSEYPAEEARWKKFRRDSLELNRRRVRAATCPRKQESMSPSPY